MKNACSINLQTLPAASPRAARLLGGKKPDRVSSKMTFAAYPANSAEVVKVSL
jgi:hypothetical protein